MVGGDAKRCRHSHTEADRAEVLRGARLLHSAGWRRAVAPNPELNERMSGKQRFDPSENTLLSMFI
jgi:hypothetical protein